MEKTSKELLKEFVNSQHFTSTTDTLWHSIKFCVKANPTSQEQGLRSKHELGFPLNCHTPAG